MGVQGLDDILGGGLPPGRLYLVQGDPGVGKTTLALQFLLEGVRRGERVLYVTLSESREELEAVAASHGWSLEGVTIQDFSAIEAIVAEPETQTVYHHAEVELGEVAGRLLRMVDETRPVRAVFDSLAELRLMAGDAFRLRRQILALKRFLTGRGCTVLLLDDKTTDASDQQLQSLVHGVICLERLAPEFGSPRRRLMVQKVRGLKYREGYHDYVITSGGVQAFPRLVAAEHRGGSRDELVKSGVANLDVLLGGGLVRGSNVVVVGPAGVGKSTLAMQYVLHGASQGRKSAVFLFDERLGQPASNPAAVRLAGYVESGVVRLQQIDPAELSPGQFIHQVREAVERDGAEIVVIDGLNGYLNAMPGERYLLLQLHELVTYLAQRGVTALMLVAQHGMLGSAMATPVDVSYLADTAILLRYFEFRGGVRQAVSVFKKRGGSHERTIREMRITENGLEIGEPLRELRGVLMGVPVVEPGAAGERITIGRDLS